MQGQPEEIKSKLNLTKLLNNLEAMMSRRSAVQEMVEEYSEFEPGVRAVLLASKRRKVLSGVCGVVGEFILELPRHLELAIESALGSAVQSVVVETESDACDAIAFLIERQLKQIGKVFDQRSDAGDRNFGKRSNTAVQE